MSYKPIEVWDLVDVDDRLPALKVLADSIAVHVVHAFRFETSKYAVDRRGWEQHEDLPL